MLNATLGVRDEDFLLSAEATIDKPWEARSATREALKRGAGNSPRAPPPPSQARVLLGQRLRASRAAETRAPRPSVQPAAAAPASADRRPTTRVGRAAFVSAASAQRRTLEGSVAVWDTRHPRFTRRHLVTCLSRGREAAKVSIED